MPEPQTAPTGPYAELIGMIETQKKVEAVAAEGRDPVEEGLPAPHEVKDRVDRAFWKTYSALVEAVVDPQLPDDLTFTKEQEWFFNFGVFPYPDFAGAQLQLSALLAWRPPANARYRFLFMTDALNRQYRDTKRVDKLKQLTEQKAKIAEAIEAHPGEVDELRKERDTAVVSELGGGGDQVLAVYERWEKLLVPYLKMEREQKEGAVFDKQKILTFTKLRADLAEVRQALTALLARNPEKKAELEAFADRLAAKHREFGDLKSDLERADNAIYKEQHEVGKISVGQVKDDLRGAVNGMKSLGTLAARKLKISPNAMPLRACRLIKQEEVLAAMAQVEEFDPRVFDNRKVKKGGRPAVILVPGTGNGVYDYTNDRLLIPLMVPREPVDSVVAAVCMYRDDIDQSVNERALMSSFKKELKDNKKIRSALKLRQKFGKLYLLYMTKETIGLPKLDREERSWFEYQIAPSKNDPRIPVDLRGHPAKQLRRMAEALEQNDGASAAGLHRLALIYCQTEERPDKAVEYITKALALAPNDALLLYNAGVLYRAANKRDKSRELLGRFLKVAGQSWWTKKAQELMR